MDHCYRSVWVFDADCVFTAYYCRLSSTRIPHGRSQLRPLCELCNHNSGCWALRYDLDIFSSLSALLRKCTNLRDRGHPLWTSSNLDRKPFNCFNLFNMYICFHVYLMLFLFACLCCLFLCCFCNCTDVHLTGLINITYLLTVFITVFVIVFLMHACISI